MRVELSASIQSRDLHFHLVLLPPWVLLQDDESFQHMREREELLRRQLRALRRPQPHWGLVRLESRDRPRLACLADDVDSLQGASSIPKEGGRWTHVPGQRGR